MVSDLHACAVAYGQMHVCRHRLESGLRQDECRVRTCLKVNVCSPSSQDLLAKCQTSVRVSPCWPGPHSETFLKEINKCRVVATPLIPAQVNL